MKNPFVIIVGILITLCVCACVLLVIVILNTRGKKQETIYNERASIEWQADNPPPAEQVKDVPQEIHDTDTVAVAAVKSVPPQLRFACGERVDADAAAKLMKEKNYFCKRSRWSKIWANPGGKGVRTERERLLFTDSIIVDSITRTMWQRFSLAPSVKYGMIDSITGYLNSNVWEGYSDWRIPAIEEIMAELLPRKNRQGFYLPKGWNCNVNDIWSCNSACDSLSMQWYWVARLAIGRCNYGRPDIHRSVIAVRSF